MTDSRSPRRPRRGARLRVRTLDSLLEEDIPPRKPLLGSWLTERHLNMTYAPAGVGKSMFAMSCALAVAGGGRFLEWDAPEPRPVLIVDGEMDVADLQERAVLLLSALPEVDRGAAGRNLHFLSQQDQNPAATFPDIATPEGQEAVAARAKRLGAALVILDNFSTLATVENENDASSFNPVIALMLRMKHAGASVMLIHHSRKTNGKATEGAYRGTSKMSVIFNSILSLTHPDGVRSRGGAAFDLTWEKFRGLCDAQVTEMRARLGHDPEGTGRWAHEVTGDDRLHQLAAMVRSLKFPTQGELAGELGVSTGALSALKTAAVRNEVISLEEWQRRMGDARELAKERERGEEFCDSEEQSDF